ncbi:two-component system sensor histidine kinase RppB [Cyanobacterium aponinum]|uniref:histidine kinase n=1 Tax=Cyanobacterium aponinum 0216 TaxID=2676140 RepID=A0A844GV53_9CHRO|nr:two-component sensor histidine kinase [Cyanobacterium aponinum 0216]
MKINRLFNQTKISLTCWYASVFSGIISLGAFFVYEAIAHAHYITINQELKTVAGTFHDTLEPLLIQPNKLEKNVKEIILDLCLIDEKCGNQSYKNRYIKGLIQQGKYYLKFYDLSGNLLGNAGVKIDNLSLNYSLEEFTSIQDNQNNNYRQISLLLHTKENKEWGYLQIGRSLEDFDRYVNNIKWLLLLGLPLLIILVIIASWYLAEKAIQPLAQSYQQMQQFGSDVAHELRTPLSAIKATIDSVFLSHNLTLEDSQETFKIIHRQNDRLINLVNDLLILTRLDSGLENTDKIKKNKINLADLINDLTEELSYLALKNQVNLTKEIKESKVFIFGNEEQIYRLLANLTINAINYNKKNGQVTICLETTKKEVIIKVSDTGIGINKEEQKLIFNRFYRINKARNREKGSCGLGLAIANAIALNHGGRIILESQENQGSIFTVYLPKIISS